MHLFNQKILDTFNSNCQTIRDRQLAKLKSEKNKIFVTSRDQLAACTSAEAQALIIDKFKILVFKLEDKINGQMQLLLQEETKKFLVALEANIKLELKELEKVQGLNDINEALAALKQLTTKPKQTNQEKKAKKNPKSETLDPAFAIEQPEIDYDHQIKEMLSEIKGML